MSETISLLDDEEPTSTTRFGDFDSVAEFSKNGLADIVEATKAVNAFPSGATRDLYCAYPAFGRIVEKQSEKILGIISNVLKHQNIKGNIQRRQQDEQFELLLECNDIMIERLNSNLDELAGIRKNPETILVETQISTNLMPNRSVGSWNVNKKSELSVFQSSARLITAKNIARPQVNFKTPIDNNKLTPFVPRIKDKPNSIKPLAVLPEYDENGEIESYLHPYEFELNKFVTPESQLKPIKVKEPKELKNTPLVHVHNEEELKNVLYELRSEKQIAVDLEHHSYRSFQGFTCLLQISTTDKDYIIDALKLREELCILNEIFTSPKVIKIFHGAESDIEWLQRDLSLYVVNMFDSHQAARMLGYPRLSLAYLLKHFCNIEADKTFQLADWRIRPLPEELIHYARQDTHYLIYIYQMLNNELLTQGQNQTNLLETVYQRSAELCKKRYHKPRITVDSHMDLYRKSKRIFDNRQLFALKEIFTWRDKVARQEDESYGYVLPNHMMLQISESLPREMQGILACCNPIPPLVRQNLNILHQIILKAREQPLVKPIINEEIVNRTVATTNKDFNSKLHCPHDLSHNLEFRDDLPTLLDTVQEGENITNLKNIKPTVSVFDTPENPENESAKEKLRSLRKIKFPSPYERYKAILPLVEKQKLEEIAKEEALNKTKQLCPVKEEPIESMEVKEENVVKPPSIKQSLKRKRINSITEVSSKAKKRGTEVNDSNKNQEKPDKNLEATETMTKEVNSVENAVQSAYKKNKKRKNRLKKRRETQNQSSNNPVEFNYSNVDFKQFQGGSQKAKQADIKTKFNRKRQHNDRKNKEFNKLLTFSNVNKKK